MWVTSNAITKKGLVSGRLSRIEVAGKDLHFEKKEGGKAYLERKIAFQKKFWEREKKAFVGEYAGGQFRTLRGLGRR